MRLRGISFSVIMTGLALIAASSASAQSFTGPAKGADAAGMVVGTKFIYHDWVFPIVNGRVSLPDCTSFAVSPTGLMSARAVTPNCKSGEGAPAAKKISGQVQQRTMADGRVVTFTIDPARPGEVTMIDDGTLNGPGKAGASARVKVGQTQPDPFQLDPAATRSIPGQANKKNDAGASKGQQSADPFNLDPQATKPSATTKAAAAGGKTGVDAKPPCDPNAKPGTTPAAGAKPPCPPKKAPKS